MICFSDATIKWALEMVVPVITLILLLLWRRVDNRHKEENRLYLQFDRIQSRYSFLAIQSNEDAVPLSGTLALRWLRRHLPLEDMMSSMMTMGLAHEVVVDFMAITQDLCKIKNEVSSSKLNHKHKNNLIVLIKNFFNTSVKPYIDPLILYYRKADDTLDAEQWTTLLTQFEANA
jgi:hypothetical protein